MRTTQLALALVIFGGSSLADQGLLFRAAFDGSLEAYSLAGVGKPISVTGGEPVFMPGRYGQALLCGPEQPLIHYATAGNLMAPAGTISMWIKPLNWTPDDPNFHVFFEAGTDGGRIGWLLFYKYYQNAWLLLRYADEQQQVGMATAQNLGWKPGEWHHIAGTWVEQALRIYVDGELVSQAPRPLVAETLGETFALGDNGWHIPHAGAQTLLDEVRIYAYPLSPARIRELAMRGRLSVTRDPMADQWRVELTVPEQLQARSARFQVVAAEGAVGQTVEAELTGRSARANLPVANLPPGQYRVTACAVDQAGQTVAETEATMHRLEQERVALENQHVRITLDGGTGGVLSIESLPLGLSCRADVAPAPLLELETVSFVDHPRFYDPTDVQTLQANEDALTRIAVERVPGGQRLTAEYHFPPAITAQVTAELPDDSAVLSLRLRVENGRPARPSQAVRIPRVSFPALSGLRIGLDGADDRLGTGRVQGELLANPGGALPEERVLQYPGSACVPWQDLHDPTGGLYYGPLADGTCQLEIVSGAEEGLLRLGCRWWALLEPGEVWESPTVEVGVHSGAWHWAAERFREWALAHTPPRQQPAWLADCHGWLGMGSPAYRFRDLPKLLEAAKYYGFFYLQLWSQMILGEAYYCYFFPNPDLGTEDELREGIAGVHAGGGKIGFYSNVITFDAGIDRNQALQAKAAQYGLTFGDGPGQMPPLPRFHEEVAPHVFVGPGGGFGNAAAAFHSEGGYLDGYWAMDPCSPWWQNYLAGWIKRWNRQYGADVWYLDSFPVHGYGLGPASFALHLDHPQSVGAGQIALLKRIREDFDGPMLYEGVACAAFMPYTNWCLGTEFSFGSGQWSRPEIFVYSFGDVYPVFSGTCNTWQGIGAIWPDLQLPRHEDAMNMVFLIGERFDVLGLYPLDTQSAFGEHVKKLVALRRKVADVVYGGRMMDERGLSGMPDRVAARIFVRQEPPGAVVTVVDRRPARAAWELTIKTRELPWPAPLTAARLLALDGSEKEAAVAADGKAGEADAATLRVRVEPPGEVYAVRLGPQ